MSKKIILGLFILLSLQVSAQRIVINGEQTSRPLTWDDFRGKPDRSATYFAYTYWNVNYIYDAMTFSGDTLKWNVTVIVALGENSWKKKDKVTDTLLQHEQGHFNIGILYAAELQQKINTTVFFKKDFQAKLNALIQETFNKYRQMELQYDNETRHFANREMQWKWNAFFDANIKKQP